MRAVLLFYMYLLDNKKKGIHRHDILSHNGMMNDVLSHWRWINGGSVSAAEYRHNKEQTHRKELSS